VTKVQRAIQLRRWVHQALLKDKTPTLEHIRRLNSMADAAVAKLNEKEMSEYMAWALPFIQGLIGSLLLMQNMFPWMTKTMFG